MSEQAILKLETVEGDGERFSAAFPRGTVVMDTGSAAVAANPAQLLLASLAGCMAMDVIGILRKKRQQVHGYEIRMSGERAAEPPKRYTHITLTHVVTGTKISRTAVEDAIRLSSDKYCSVHHTLRPDLVIENPIEIIEG
jgi:putative redox protein